MPKVTLLRAALTLVELEVYSEKEMRKVRSG